MTLGEKQQAFALNVARLIVYAKGIGLAVTFGEAYRTPEQAKLNAQKGSGIANTLHTRRLAIDLNLFKDGEYQTDSEAHRPLAEYWKSLDPLNRWGGDWMTRKDGNHYSMTDGGIE